MDMNPLGRRPVMSIPPKLVFPTYPLYICIYLHLGGCCRQQADSRVVEREHAGGGDGQVRVPAGRPVGAAGTGRHVQYHTEVSGIDQEYDTHTKVDTHIMRQILYYDENMQIS